MTSAMSFMTITLTFAGVVQTHLQRVLGMGYMEVQDQLEVFFWMRLASGVFVVIAALIFVYSLFAPVRTQSEAPLSTQPAT